MKVFLSHSTKDKPSVRRLGGDLRGAGVDVGFDEWEIQIGGSISRKIEEGIESSDYIAVWLTQYAVISRWVEHEWRTKFRAEIDSGQVLVLPLLAETCAIPTFLQDKRYADFRSNYDTGLKELLARLGSSTSKPHSSSSRTAALAEILVLFDSTQWVLDILNLIRPFDGDASTLEKRKRLNIAEEILKKIELKLARFTAEHGQIPELNVNDIFKALQYLIRITDRFLPPLGERRTNDKKQDGSEWFTASDALCDLLPRSGSQITPSSHILNSDPLLNAEFTAIRADDTRLYQLIGFSKKDEYRQYVNPSVSTLVSNAQPPVLAVLRELINVERTTDVALLESGLDWLSVETVINSMLDEKLLGCDYKEPTTVWLTPAGKGRLSRLLGESPPNTPRGA